MLAEEFAGLFAVRQAVSRSSLIKGATLLLTPLSFSKRVCNYLITREKTTANFYSVTSGFVDVVRNLCHVE